MKHGDKNNLTQMTTAINYTKSIIPILWEFLDRQRGRYSISVNVVTVGDESLITIINRKKVKRFRIMNNSSVLNNLRTCLKVN